MVRELHPLTSGLRRSSRHFLVWVIVLTSSFAGFFQAFAETGLERGATVRVMRDQVMLFYGKPKRQAKAGETYVVLDVQPATKQVYVGVGDGERLVAMSMPIDAVLPEKQAKTAERMTKTDALFAGLIPRINLRIAPGEVEKLRKEPRSYVEASIEEVDGKTYDHLAVKLKGSAGSFRGIDDKPGFSFNCTKLKGGDHFHGLKRFQLNNCAQDGTAMNEMLGGEMARAAKVPASRCTNALVTLNGRDLGIYVLKEGFTEEFLAPFFKRTDGNLYDGGFCAEIQEKMEQDRGEPGHNERLLELVAAMKEPDAEKQFARLSAVVDVDAYLRHLAMENILAHWDGYSFNRNNYRIYEDPETGKFHFILHGMDQVYGDPNATVQRDPGGQVGAILWRRPEIRERYWIQLKDIYDKVLKPIDWPARVDENGARLMAALQNVKPELAKNYEPNIKNAHDRVAARLKYIAQQIEAPRVVNTLLTKGIVDLAASQWAPQVENMESQELDADGRRCLYLKAKGDGTGSWRLGVQVPAGKYRLEAQVKTKDVDPLPGGSGDGAGLRVSGASRQGQKMLSGTTPWQPLTYDIDSPGRDFTLVLELRAKAGEMWIDRKSLHVVRVP